MIQAFDSVDPCDPGDWYDDGPRQAGAPIRWGSRLSLLVLALSAVVFVLVAVLPRAGTYRTYTVLSDSMRPHFAHGDMVVATPEPATAVRTGQVISFHAPIPGRPVVSHRVVSVRRDAGLVSFTTRGDANPAVDPWTARVPAGSSMWRVRAALGGLGSVESHLRGWVRRSTLLELLGLATLFGMLGIWARPVECADPAFENEHWYVEVDDEYGLT